MLRTVYAEIFERELNAWHTDEGDWPPNRTFAMFRNWFEVEMHSAVEDLCGHELFETVPEQSTRVRLVALTASLPVPG